MYGRLTNEVCSKRREVAGGQGCPRRCSTSVSARLPRRGSPKDDPDACLINCHIAGAKLSLHQDRDEKDAWAPIVSVSVGLPAVFLWCGKRRSDALRRLRLETGDIVVWGGPAHFAYHGVAPLKDGQHPLTGDARINLTFRKVF